MDRVAALLELEVALEHGGQGGPPVQAALPSFQGGQAWRCQAAPVWPVAVRASITASSPSASSAATPAPTRP